jgi:xanthine dehydrogenase YagT iron-sulfur-binding subunit
MNDYPVDRRTVLATGAASAALFSLKPALADARGSMDTQTVPSMREVVLSVNGTDRPVQVDTRMTLLDALRDKLGLAGSKKGCDHGQCGACTIHIDGERHLACLTLTVAAQGRRITTVEGLAEGDRLHPMQQAFIDHDAFQCGYCTPGQIMSAIACVYEGHAGSDKDIREYMSGNLCRCAAYPNIVAAVNQAKTAMEKG